MSRKFLAIAALFAMACAPARADLIIDNFDAGPQAISIQSGTSSDTATGLPTSDVLGGERSVELTVDSNPGDLFASVNIVPAVGAFGLSNDAFVSSTAVLSYFGTGGGGLVPPVNLAAFGTQFSLDILSVDLTLSLTLQVFTAGGDLAVSRTNLSAGVLNIGFDEFGAVDLTQVTGIRLTLVAPNDADIVLNSIGVTTAATPEPSALALGLAGAALLGSRRIARGVRGKLAPR